MSWSLEWRTALAARRLFAFNVLVPLALVLPVILGGAPRAHAAVVFTLLFAFFGVFGQAIPLARDAERGLVGRFLLAGARPASFLLGRIAAHATIDALQLAPACGVILVAYRAAPADALALAGALLLALLAANTIGALLAACARSIAEAALFSAVTALFLLHGAGVFRTPAAGSLAATLQDASPFALLHEAVMTVAGSPFAGLRAPAPLAAAATTALLGAALLALAPRLGRAFVRPAA